MKTYPKFNNTNFSLKRSVLFALLFVMASVNLKAADYFWVGGSGNWSDYAAHWATASGGSIFHTAIPTLNDDVYFDANSFSSNGQQVLIDNTLIYCNNMNWTGAQFNPVMNGLGNALHIYGSLTLIPAMSWNVKRMDFLGTNPGNLISQAGNLLDTLYFNGMGTFAFTENVNAKSIYVYDGSLSTNGFDVTTQKFIFGTTGATVNGDLSNSTINISDVFNSYYGTVNLTSATCDLNFVNAVVSKTYLWSNGHTFNNIFCQSNTEVIGSFNCQLLTANSSFYINNNWGNVTCTDATFGGNTTLDCNFNANNVALTSTGVFIKIRQLSVSNSFTANGVCGEPIQIRPIDFLNTGNLIIPSGTITVEYSIITSMQASGGATFIANNSVDGGNNTGWTINGSAPRTLYWIGGTGNWEDENHWSLTSGGPGGNCVPSLLDDVFFDSNSFSQAGEVVTINNSPATCKNMNWTGVTFNPAINGTGGMGSVTLYGSMVLSAGVQWNLYAMQFSGTGVGNTILTAGVQIPGLVIDGSGSWTLLDEFHGDGLSVYQGTFNSGNNDIYADVFSANGNNSAIFVDFGTSTLYLGERYVAFSNQLNISSANANVVMEQTTGTSMEFQTYDAIFNHVTFIDGAYVGKLTCNRLDAYAGVALTDLTALTAEFRASFQAVKLTADSLIFSAGVHEFLFDTAQINVDWTLASDCANTLSLNRYNPFNSQAVLSSPVTLANLEYLVINNIQATGGGSFVANNSLDLGNNTGWTINMAASRNLYWIGGTGVWNDNSHWSLTSGGAGGECQPAMQDNVIFDANSFAQSGDTVYVHPTLGVYVNNLTFTSIPNATVLYSSSGNAAMNVSGSLTLPAELDLYSVVVNMTSANTGNTLSSGGNTFTQISFTGSGDWTLQDDLNASNFSAGSGTFMSNGYAINVGGVNVGGNATLDFGTSTITVIGFWSNFNVTIIGGNANLVMTSSFLSLQLAGAHFNSITFTGTANTTTDFSCNYLIANGNFTNVNSSITAGKATFKSNVNLPLNFICDTLVLDNPGKIFQFANMTINGTIVSNGNSGFPIQIEGINGSGLLQKSSGQICLDYVLIKDVIASGGALFYAGANGVDLGGNSGWVFGPCIPLLTDVWPGDANYDLTADNNDILNIGLAYGYSGPVRAGASLAWVAQPATNWSSQFANGANLKHADTDGSGLVDNDDTTAVSLNYGLNHPLRLGNPNLNQLPTPVLYITTNPDTATTSDTVEVSIFLGTSAVPVDSIYGIAFTVNFDTALVNTSYMNPDFSACWLGTPQVDLLTFNKDLMSQGRVDVALVRTDQSNTNGFGFLGKLGIVIVDNVGAKVTLPVTLSDITAITASEYLVPIAFENDSVIIDTTGTVGLPQQLISNDQVSVYPNPADQFIQISSQDAIVDKYVVFNQYGNPVVTNELTSKRFKVPTNTLSQGVYSIQLFTDKGVVIKKFLVVRK